MDWVREGSGPVAAHFPNQNPITTMKKTSLLPMCALLFALAGGAVLQTGCGSTATRQSTGEYIDDATITAKVKAALASDDLVKAREVNVETYKGVVQLSGFVSTVAERTQAGLVASGVTGVQSVTNNIQIK
jgi:hyperosmotically inducible protein